MRELREHERVLVSLKKFVIPTESAFLARPRSLLLNCFERAWLQPCQGRTYLGGFNRCDRIEGNK